MFVWRVFPGRADARPGAFLGIPSLESAGIRAAFTSRTGGLSEGDFASLNLSFFSGDDPAKVRANRERVLEVLGGTPDRWTGGKQVHGAAVAHVGAHEAGMGAFDHASTIPGTDGLWTEVPGVPLAVLTADCVPVLLADTDRRRIAVLHAGWRGLIEGILGAGAKELGGEPESLQAFIGPSIGPCCYEVGEDVAGLALVAFGDRVLSRIGNRVFLDLWTAARLALARAGVRNIWPAALCTRGESHRFFSHRSGAAARQGLVAMIA